MDRQRETLSKTHSCLLRLAPVSSLVDTTSIAAIGSVHAASAGGLTIMLECYFRVLRTYR